MEKVEIGEVYVSENGFVFTVIEVGTDQTEYPVKAWYQLGTDQTEYPVKAWYQKNTRNKVYIDFTAYGKFYTQSVDKLDFAKKITREKDPEYFL